MHHFALYSRRVVTPSGVREAVVEVAGEKIVAVHDEAPPDLEVTSLGDLALLPGLVDSHVHVNEPGRTAWEGWATATRAAVAGGVTTLVDMPLNSSPVTTSPAALEAKRRAATEAGLSCDVGYWGGAVPGNDRALRELARDGALGAKAFLCPSGIDEFPASDGATLPAAMRALADADRPLLLHAELEHPLDRAALAALPRHDHRRWLEARPPSFEEHAVELAIALARRTGCRVHVVHLSAAGALPVLRRAKERGLPITVETCPHYLGLTADEVPPGATWFKCAPPIRSATNRELLWEGLREGVIDFVVSDHSPCTPDLKHTDSGDFEAAWGGIGGLGLSLPVTWAEARARGLGLEKLARWLAEGPAELLGLREKGRIAPGADADLVAFDSEARWAIGEDDLHFKNKLTPWRGREVLGRVVSTWLRGELAFERGVFGPPRGAELTR